jgi:hypothetical protein
MILEKQELFTPGFSEVRYMTDDPKEAGTVYSPVTNRTENRLLTVSLSIGSSVM